MTIPTSSEISNANIRCCGGGWKWGIIKEARDRKKVEISKGGTVIGKESTRGLWRNFNDISYFQPFLGFPSTPRLILSFFPPFFLLRLFIVIVKVIFYAGTFARLLYLPPNFIYHSLINDVSGSSGCSRKLLSLEQSRITVKFRMRHMGTLSSYSHVFMCK